MSTGEVEGFRAIYGAIAFQIRDFSVLRLLGVRATFEMLPKQARTPYIDKLTDHRPLNHPADLTLNALALFRSLKYLNQYLLNKCGHCEQAKLHSN